MINLLPPQQMKNLENMEVSGWINKINMLALFGGLTVALYLVFMGFFLQLELAGMQNQTFSQDVEKKASELKRFEDEVESSFKLIEKSKVANAELMKGVPWSDILVTVALAADSGVRYEELALNDNLTAIELSGKADSRDSVIKLERNLNNSSLFSEVEAPVSNLTSPTDVQFKFVLRLANGLAD